MKDLDLIITNTKLLIAEAFDYESKTDSQSWGALQLSPITVNEDYRQKWNIHQNDFVCLTRNGVLISDSLYRVGGFGADLKGDYFMLIKHVEAYYEDSITKVKKDKPHLAGCWCILDKNGVEKVVFDRFKTPYPIKNSQVYSIDSNYYNIETGEFYCQSSTRIDSTDFIFLENRYDKDESKRGVLKINKKDGSWELFK